MDTRLCDGVHALAEGCDLLVIESTFLDEDERLAVDHGHLTAGQAARVARDAGVRHLVLTHFSQRYSDPAEFERAGARRRLRGRTDRRARPDAVPNLPERGRGDVPARRAHRAREVAGSDNGDRQSGPVPCFDVPPQS